MQGNLEHINEGREYRLSTFANRSHSNSSCQNATVM